jgi:competence protein ComEC
MAAGILFADKCNIEVGWGYLAGLLPIFLFLCWRLNNSSYDTRWVFGAGVSCFMFLVGVVLTGHAWKEVRADWASEKKAYRAIVQESVQEKQRSFQVPVDIEGKDVWLYMAKDSLSASLMPGDELYVYTRMESPKNYLYYKGISGTAYVPSEAWQRTESMPQLNLKMKALRLREKILEKYRQWGIEAEPMPVLSALTLGHKGSLDKETREAYAVAGISHVLALSGMHVGIIWLLLDVLLRPLAGGRFRWLKGLFVIASLWGFAFVVGLEASVVRAVLMCMLVEISRLSGFKPFSLNTLGIAAFFMLLYQPFYLFDVGFQLSFVAVLSILVLYPLFFQYFAVKGKVKRWIGGVMSLSLAAQLGTAPLVMYYFSSFSVYFLLTNLVAAVMVPFIIYGAVLMVLTSGLPMVQEWVVKLLNEGVMALNGLAGWTSALPYATFSFSIFRPIEVMVFYAMMGVWVMYWKNRKRSWLIGGLAMSACLLGIHFCLLLVNHFYK